jgi:hypothetical protein
MDRPATFPPRSNESLAFEEFWKSLRVGDLVPRRSDFHPRKAARFLKDVLFMEAPSRPLAAGRIRVTGDRFNEIAGADWMGRDDVDFFPPSYQADALASRRLMIENPCGLWQISPARLAKGHIVNLQITAFPLAPDDGDTFFLLCQVLAVPGVIGTCPPARAGMTLDTASAFSFLDIGAGEPEWTPKAA